MADQTIRLFEHELQRRGIGWSVDKETGRHVVDVRGMTCFVSLDNLRREMERNGDPGCVVRFVEILLGAPTDPQPWSNDRSRIYFALEPSDYAEKPDIYTPVSDRIDRLPVLYDADRGAVAFVSKNMIAEWQVTLDDVVAAANRNLAQAMAETKVEYQEIDGVRLGMLGSVLPFKASLILAPNLKEMAASILGWPLYAVAPDRNFLFLWDATHNELVNRIGPTVVEEYRNAPYPLSTEVYLISDEGVSTIGAFPVDP